MDASEPPLSSRHLGLDLGATNLKWVVLERRAEAWTVVSRGQVATRIVDDREAIPDAVIDQLIAVGLDASAAWGPVGTAGIGVPGLYDPATGTTRFLVNLPGPWAGHPVAPRVSEALGMAVSLVNDARAFGLAELRLGAGRGASSMIGLTLGTGIGGVIAIDGRVHQGHDGTAGEIGHQTIDPEGPPCGCGNRGCLEAFARADRITAACGTATVEDAVTRARAGDVRALEGLTEIARYIGIGIANLIVLISPDRVVIGGGMSAAADLLFPTIREELDRRVRTTSLDQVELVTAELGTWAGAIGAAIHGAEATARPDPSVARQSPVAR